MASKASPLFHGFRRSSHQSPKKSLTKEYTTNIMFCNQNKKKTSFYIYSAKIKKNKSNRVSSIWVVQKQNQKKKKKEEAKDYNSYEPS